MEYPPLAASLRSRSYCAFVSRTWIRWPSILPMVATQEPGDCTANGAEANIHCVREASGAALLGEGGADGGDSG